MATNFVRNGDVDEVVESALVHPTHTDGFVDSGDPVTWGGSSVGVALEAAAASTDTVSVARTGVFTLSVTGTDNSGNSAVAVGNALYIDGSTAAITKNATKIAFGYACGAVNSAATASIDVRLLG